MFGTIPLLVATTNAGKLRDFAAAFSQAQPSHGFLLQPLHGLASLNVPVEDADSFFGNAAIKAVAYSRHAAGQLVLADDSGLVVDALNGAPGIHSARYAEEMNFSAGLQQPAHRPPDPAYYPDARNNACLLHALAQFPAAARTARYHCVLTVARDGQLLTFRGQPVYGSGSTEGTILLQPRGTGGFGYDSLFLLPNGRTMAEIDLPTRLTFSHRTRALTDLLPKLAAVLEAVAAPSSRCL